MLLFQYFRKRPGCLDLHLCVEHQYNILICPQYEFGIHQIFDRLLLPHHLGAGINQKIL